MIPNASVSGSAARERTVKKPIGRSLLITMLVMFAILCGLIFFVLRWLFSAALYDQFDSKLTGVVTYIENNVDADDLKVCLETGKPSEKYDELQAFLNGMIDDMDIDYIYIVIPSPSEKVMINAVSATSAAERAAGETDMPILYTTDAYSAEELAIYRSYWDADGINFFEETSDFGTYYTACKPLRDSNGETVALICVDLLSSELHSTVNGMVVYGLLIVAFVFLAFGLFTAYHLNRRVTAPVRALERSTRLFSSADRGSGDLVYDAPVITHENEVASLAAAIKTMTSDIIKYVNDIKVADQRALEAEEEAARLSEKAASAAKIAELSASISTLLDNMPALTFYKDAETGEYVACNQAFADYAKKSSPKDVVGLTDFDIFDRETAEHFTDDDKKALGANSPLIFLEDAPDASGVPKHFQTTKLKFIDTDGKLRLLGMCVDMTEMASARRESEKAREAYEAAMSASLTYSRIARALSTDYSYLYYVNIENDEYIEYRSDKSIEDLSVENQGSDFFTTARRDAVSMLYEDDRQGFINAFSKQNVLEHIDSTGAFTYSYRLLVNGEPTYVNLKATRIIDDSEHIIIGVSNIDAQMKYQEAFERVKEERITYARITALSGDFICVYTVDPKTGNYTEYSATKDYEEFGFAKKGEDFFARAREDGIRSIYYEDIDLFVTTVTKENVMSEIEKHGLFALNYRLMIDGSPEYVTLKAAMIQEKDGPQLIIGVSNIDAQVKREQEYAHNLSVERSKANIDAMTGVKNKHAYIDAEAQLNGKIENAEAVEFAIAVFDVNGLKIANDTLGHRAGDDLIKKACETICLTFKYSPVFRIGGDEFVVIAQGRDYESADALISEIGKLNLKNAKEGGVVVACGVAKYRGEKNVAAVFEKADKEMYANKRMLKNVKE
ncbi:MAG: diguanylate cyclase [Clostridia bacterium]|nr:diguanylate cyclase [Clostridia bacterium]